MKFSIVTPSYRNDFEQCKLLTESIEKFVPKDIEHYIIIPKEDLELFNTIKQERTRFLFQEDFMPKWLKPLPFTGGKWFYSFRTYPVRGWIRQQMVKLGICEVIDSDYYIVIDSDCFFLKEFNPKNFIKDSKLPMYREPEEQLSEMFSTWNKISFKLLGKDEDTEDNACYVGFIMFWSRSTLRKLKDELERVNNQSWMRLICNQLRFSEYTLYGNYVSRVLGIENTDQFFEERNYTVSFWEERPYSKEELFELKSTVKDHHYGAMISAKSGTNLNLIREVFFK